MPVRVAQNKPQQILPCCRAFAVRASILSALYLAQAMSAQAEGCRLALVLALDVSGSVSNAEDQLQRGGLAAALMAPEVSQAFLGSGPVAVYAFEWAGVSYQSSLSGGWVMIESRGDLLRVADAVTQMRRYGERQLSDGTAVGSALIHAAAAFEAGPGCTKRTVDVSGDGVNSQGLEPQTVLNRLYQGITVNALVIHERIEDPMLERQLAGETTLVTWFNDSVVHGPGAFSIVADGYEDYENAMITKLLRELSLPMMSNIETVVQDLGQMSIREM